MLNYVWLALIVLGLAAALTTDISDKVTNKFQSGNQIPFYISLNENFSVDKKQVDGVAILTKENLKNYFNIASEKDIELKTKFTRVSDNQLSSVMMVDESTPTTIKKIASASGKDDDLFAQVTILSKSDSLTFNTQIKMEDASFLKLKEITNSSLSSAEVAVKIALGLIGIMALWLGVMRIAEQAGLINSIARSVRPLTKLLFPDVPHDHPAMGSIVMNLSANFLGLGNAATPFGLKAMEELDKLNPEKGTATNAMCTFLAINTAGLTLIPATAIAIRASAGSAEPAIIIGTALFGSFCATVTAIISTKILEKFPFQKGGVGDWFKSNSKLFGIILGVISLIAIISLSGLGSTIKSFLSFINPESLKIVITIISSLAIPLLILTFVTFGFIKKVKVYECFVEGAKEGFNVAVRIIPFLVAMLMAIGIFRAGGAMDWLIFVLQPITSLIGMPAEALPMALMRPLSGSGSLGIMAEIISVHGPDSFLGILVSTIYGSTETTFYVLAVYFGSVGIKKTRHALPAGLLADMAGILGALFIVRLLFA